MSNVIGFPQPGKSAASEAASLLQMSADAGEVDCFIAIAIGPDSAQHIEAGSIDAATACEIIGMLEVAKMRLMSRIPEPEME
jgi:hypothetical protein